MRRFGLPNPGLGVGLRACHFRQILAEDWEVGWFEAISENFMADQGRSREALRAVSGRWPVVLHGVSLSIGGSDPLDAQYLDRLRGLADEAQALWVSDHLCWTGLGGHTTHDLLPLPRTPEALAHVVGRVRRVQAALGRRILLENPSTYVDFQASCIPEPEFLGAIAEQADCGVLLDVNNVVVSAQNHGWDAAAYLDGLPWERVVQLHVAGHSVRDGLAIDTHDQPVPDAVLALHARAQALSGGLPTLLEWDDHIPPFPALLEEARRVWCGRPAPPTTQDRGTVSTPVDFMAGVAP